jgi:toxin YoeB
MNYVIELTQEAEADIQKHKKSGDKSVLYKIDQLLDELREHPSIGTGKPELLKHYKIPTWSRRINQKHRLVYRIEEEKIVVLVLSLSGHYEDK